MDHSSFLATLPPPCILPLLHPFCILHVFFFLLFPHFLLILFVFILLVHPLPSSSSRTSSVTFLSPPCILPLLHLFCILHVFFFLLFPHFLLILFVSLLVVHPLPSSSSRTSSVTFLSPLLPLSLLLLFFFLIHFLLILLLLLLFLHLANLNGNTYHIFMLV